MGYALESHGGIDCRGKLTDEGIKAVEKAASWTRSGLRVKSFDIVDEDDGGRTHVELEVVGYRYDPAEARADLDALVAVLKAEGMANIAGALVMEGNGGTWRFVLMDGRWVEQVGHMVWQDVGDEATRDGGTLETDILGTA